jgi:hypothetical protein
MEPVVGIFPSSASAETAARELHARGLDPGRVQLLLSGTPSFASSASSSAEVPSVEAEQSGMGQAVGGVVGGAAGASAGFGLGAVTASLLVPGVGVVTAIGLAAAALFGVAGAIGGAAAGAEVEESTREGLPKDELHVYEHALSHGKSVVFAQVESEREEELARRVFEAAGAESLDAAREAWWVGIRDVEKAHAESRGHDFETTEVAYRRGYLAGLQPSSEGKTYSEALAGLRSRHGDLAAQAGFQQGYERGAEVASRRKAELEAPAGRG